MISHEAFIGAIFFAAFYFFLAGIVAEHSSSNLHKNISSPLPSIVRGLAWPLVMLKYALLMIWGCL
ncbi:hypothetical protein ACE8EZ_22175 [Pantoea deleyi]|uniref:hypothetical protein n=1 Tax=Pantoea deleyi TaxID=470932 RepID=UPI0035D4E545